MKLLRLIICLLCFGALTSSVQAQEIHYTLYDMSPLTLNPAQTGAFYGTVRVGGIFRTQWWAVDDNLGYETPAFYIDAPIIRGFREQDWVGIGAVIVNDRAGSLGLKNTATMFSASYHLGLGKDGNSVLTLGIQGGNVQRSLILGDLGERAKFGDSFEDGNFSQNTEDPLAGGGPNSDPGSMNPNTSFLDFGTGLMFKQKNEDGDGGFEVGVSVDNVNRPKTNFSSLGNQQEPDSDRKPIRIGAHTRFEFPLDDRWSAAPTAFFQTQRGAYEFSLQGWAGYLFDPEKDITFNFGLGYRLGDSPNILLGADIKDLRVAASFDINTSQYRTATDYQGAFEIAAWYIIKKYKKPEIKPAILCPRF